MIIYRCRLLGAPESDFVDIVVEGETISQVGPTGSMPLDGHDVVDADGRVVIPGLWDEHVHFGLWAQHRRRVDLSGASCAEEAAALMAVAVEANRHQAVPDPVVVGAGYRDGLWPDQKTTALLDALVGDTPVLLLSVDVHSCWVNTATLKKFDIVGRGVEGVLVEQECFDLTGRVGQVADEVLDSWVADAATAAAARGVVGVVDLDMSYNSVNWVRRARQFRNGYPVRVESGIYPGDLERAISDGLYSGMPLAPGIEVGPFKIITDGSLNTRTAHCVEPYLGISGVERGAMNFSTEEIEQILVRASNAGFWLAVHAIGDEANRLVLDVMERNSLGGRIEPAQLVREEDLPRFHQLGITASVQPEHAVDDRDVTDVYWADRTERAFALRSLVNAGAKIVLGSDAPVAPLDPWVGIAAAVTRTRDGREPWHIEQALSVTEALNFSTRSTIEAGQPADLVILDADPLWLVNALRGNPAKASEALRSMPVAHTLCRGQVTFTAG
jgi:predicted amidohydrolase YtcJ